MLTELIQETLRTEGLKETRFREILQRLYAYNIVVRDSDATEQRFYDDARRVEKLLTEYLAISGFRLVHDIKNEYFRLYPPGAQIPGIADDELDAVPALRTRLSADFVAAALALRLLFQQGLMEGGGKLADTGDVLIRFDELAAVMQTQIKRPLPEGAGEREKLLRELKRQRLVHYGAVLDMEDEDALIVIKPTILGIIGEDAMASALEAAGSIEIKEEQLESSEEEEK